jgi:hypothetical protein
MSISSLIRRLAEAGASAEAIAIAVEAVEEAAPLKPGRSLTDTGRGAYVYVLERADGLVKVGVSVDVDRRIQQLNTQHKKKHALCAEFFYRKEQDAYCCESRTHKELSFCRVEGEYFKNTITKIVRTVERLHIQDTSPVAVFMKNSGSEANP